MQKLTITKVYKSNKDRHGNLFKFSSGESYTKLAILTQEYGDKKWISGFLSEGNKDWKDGDVVEAIVEEKGEWLNFKIPESPLEKRVKQLESRIADLDKELEGKFAQLKGSLVLEMTGKFQTSEDYNKNNADYGIPVETPEPKNNGEVSEDEIPF